MRQCTLSFLVFLPFVACSSSNSDSTPDTKADASGSTPKGGSDAGTRTNAGGRDTGSSGSSGANSSGSGGSSGNGGSSSGSGGSGGAGAVGGSGGGTDAASGEAPKTCIGTKPLSTFLSDPKLCVYTFSENLGAARGLAFAPNGDLFVNNGGKITVLWDANSDGYSDTDERKVFAQVAQLNHGLTFSRDNKFLYASSPSTVYRFPYSKDQRAAAGDPEVVIKGIPSGGGHVTRTLAFDSKGRLYVTVGSSSNVDSEDNDIKLRAQIRRYELPATIDAGGIAYETGEAIATGMRNEVGLYVDEMDRVWGVENGRDNLVDDDLGGDIHTDNPGEEINLIDGQGSKFYGYPSCWSELKVSGGKGPGTQWADQSVVPSLLKDDTFCGDPTNVHPPAYVMPAHWAPLGVIVYTGRSLPYTGDLIIAAHGSWNREPATGRVIARAKLQGSAVTEHEVIVGQKDSNGKLTEGNWQIRPVDVRQGPDEAVYVSDDQTGNILKIGYQQ